MIKKYKADVNSESDTGESVLSTCVIHDNSELLFELIRRGANIFHKDIKSRDYSPFFIAINL